jgi:3-oxoacyl-(acyl-carrier-protein) synthase
MSTPPAEAAVGITGMGIVSAAGRGLDATEDALRSGRSNLSVLTRFESPRCGHHVVAEVAAVDATPRTLALSRAALSDALEDATRGGRWPHANDRVALVLGTIVGGMAETEEAVASQLAGRDFDAAVWTRHGCDWTTTALAEEFEVRGPAFTISNACSAGAQALAMGSELLRAGLADVVFAGGADSLCRLTLNGFASLLAMDPTGCKPFDRRRAGMSLGEGAAFCVLERVDDARARGCSPAVELAGAGNTCDAYHTTAPEPEGRGAEGAMRAALAQAGLRADQIGYVNAHGTGTPGNDLAEGRALARLFGDAAPPISSTKAVFGHTLGAAGAIEAVVCALALTRGFVPGTVALEETDPECRIEPLREMRAADVRVALSNSFGFGGNNTVLAFRGFEDAS